MKALIPQPWIAVPKEFLSAAIDDYNASFKTNFGVDSQGFPELLPRFSPAGEESGSRSADRRGYVLDWLSMPQRSTPMFVDKHLRYHGLMQAFFAYQPDLWRD